MTDNRLPNSAFLGFCLLFLIAGYVGGQMDAQHEHEKRPEHRLLFINDPKDVDKVAKTLPPGRLLPVKCERKDCPNGMFAVWVAKS